MRGLRGNSADAQLDSAHPRCLESLESTLRHPRREFDEAVIVADVYVANVPAIQSRLVCNCAYDAPGLDTVGMADLDAECLEPRPSLDAAGLARLNNSFRLAFARVLVFCLARGP
jgi:hypothetical protein